ncbi:hypothetical protein EJB05_34103, partial [Eragrostis curvula]
MASGEDAITVHVQWLARRLTAQQEDAAATEQPRVTHVPSNIRLAKRDAYTPGLVAIGPLHAGDSERRLRPGHRLKMAYLNSLISRGHPDPADHLEVIKGYVGLVAKREREAAPSPQRGELHPNDGAGRLLHHRAPGERVHRARGAVAARDAVRRYAAVRGPHRFLAENQMPFFVLIDLIKHTRLPPEFDTTGFDKPTLLMKLVLYYLAGEKGRDMGGLPNPDGVSHILHLLYKMVTDRGAHSVAAAAAAAVQPAAEDVAEAGANATTPAAPGCGPVVIPNLA